nr:hypothetical protein [uncultured Flavobacterium sp.]
MNRPVVTYNINKAKDIPSDEVLLDAIQNNVVMLVFSENLKSLHEKTGKDLKTKLEGYYVEVNIDDSYIKINRLITDEEIEANIDFFEQCAKDYRSLSKTLIYRLAEHLGVALNKDFPSETLNPLHAKGQNKGKFNNWNYYLHGFHVHFYNVETGQEIEAPFMFGDDYGDLDPYFFPSYIISTPRYKPLPVAFNELYHDGKRILDKMLELGKLERVQGNWPRVMGTIVTDRRKIEIKILKFDKKVESEPIKFEKKKFSLLRFLRLRK